MKLSSLKLDNFNRPDLKYLMSHQKIIKVLVIFDLVDLDKSIRVISALKEHRQKQYSFKDLNTKPGIKIITINITRTTNNNESPQALTLLESEIKTKLIKYIVGHIEINTTSNKSKYKRLEYIKPDLGINLTLLFIAEYKLLLTAQQFKSLSTVTKNAHYNIKYPIYNYKNAKLKVNKQVAVVKYKNMHQQYQTALLISLQKDIFVIKRLDLNNYSVQVKRYKAKATTLKLTNKLYLKQTQMLSLQILEADETKVLNQQQLYDIIAQAKQLDRFKNNLDVKQRYTDILEQITQLQQNK